MTTKVATLPQLLAFFSLIFIHSFAIALNLPAKNITITAKTCTSITLQWNRGDGQLCLVTCAKTWQPIGLPTDGGSFAPNSYYGQGADIGNENYVIFSGIDSFTTVYGLQEDSTYVFRIFEFDYSPFVYNKSNFPQCVDSTYRLLIKEFAYSVLDSCRYRNKVEFKIQSISDFAITDYAWVFLDTTIHSSGGIVTSLNQSGIVPYRLHISPDLGCKNQIIKGSVYIIAGSTLPKFYDPLPGCSHSVNSFIADVINDKVSKTSFTRNWLFDNGDHFTTLSVLRYNTDTTLQHVRLIVNTNIDNKYTGCSDTFHWDYKLHVSPVFDLGRDTCFHKGDLFKVSAPIAGNAYYWNGKAGNAVYYAKDSGYTYLRVSDIHGCDFTDSMHLDYCVGDPVSISSFQSPETIRIATTGQSGCLNIENFSMHEAHEIHIYSCIGKLLYQNNIGPREKVFFNAASASTIIIRIDNNEGTRYWID